MVSVPQNRSFPIYGLNPIGSHCVPMGLNPSQLPFVLEGAVKIDILKSRKGIGEPPNGPSGPRRECAVQAFLPQAKTLAEGRLRRPEHSNTEGWRPPPAAGTQNKRQLLSQLPFVLVPVTGLEPVRCRQRWILSPLRLPIPSHRHNIVIIS